MLSFGRKNSSELLNTLKKQSGELAKSPLDTELANQCAINAWSLCDWVFKEHGKQLGLTELKQLQVQMKQNCPSLALLQDVANASKHMKITKFTPTLKVAEKHDGLFDPELFDSSFFDVDALYLERVDDSKILFEIALNDVIKLWDDFFNSNKL